MKKFNFELYKQNAEEFMSAFNSISEPTKSMIVGFCIGMAYKAFEEAAQSEWDPDIRNVTSSIRIVKEQKE